MVHLHVLDHIQFLSSPGARAKKVAYFRTHLVESRDLLFLEAEIVDNIFQWDVLKNKRQIKSYDDMFQAIRPLTVQKNSQNKNLKSKTLAK